MARRTGCTASLLTDAPGVLVGSVEQCAEKLIALRERTGISYIQLEAGGKPRADIATVAPLVARLSGT